MRVRVLGPLELVDGRDQEVELSGRRLRELVMRLAVEGGAPVSADRLLDDLWPGERPSANALQALVSRLRAGAGRDLVESGSGGYRLALDPRQVDAHAFEAAATRGRGLLGTDPAAAAALLGDALALWRGPALAEVADAPWATGQAVRLEERRLGALEDRAEAELTLGRGADVVAELEGLAAGHPLRERTAVLLMRALTAAGRPGEALQAYERIRGRLAEELGADPSAELAAQHLTVLRRDEREPRAGNLPAQITSFVGREEELRNLGGLLGSARLVTLTGPGGAGKTRLATEAGAAADPPDGVWFVPLAPVRDAIDVPQAILAALGLDQVRIVDARDMVPPADRLLEWLAGRRLLIVLDNCEHLVDAVAVLAGRVLAVAPGVRVLATSREPLGITGEVLCPVPSLALPDTEDDPAGALGHAAVRLFADRAAAVRPGFEVTGANVGPVVRICRALDGMPLAIELAAARMRAMTPAQVAERLADRFRLLRTGSRAAAPRHQTLRAIVDWSWELLDGPERAVLRRLSVFRGGGTPEAAEAVCSVGGDIPDVVEVVASLVDKSLVVASGDSEVRYRLLETVRVYAGERLAEAGEADLVRGAHTRWFVDLAEAAESHLRAREQLWWAERLAAERANFSAALGRAIENRDVPTGLRLVAGLMWFWVLRDYEAEAAEWATKIMNLADGPPPGMTGDAYAICSLMAGLAADLAAGEPDRESIARALRAVTEVIPEDPAHPALALAVPLFALFEGRTDQARAGLIRVTDHRDPWVRAAVRTFTGYLDLNDGLVPSATAELTAGLTGFRDIGDRWGTALAASGLSGLLLMTGDLPGALTAAEEAFVQSSEGIGPDKGATLRIHYGWARILNARPSPPTPPNPRTLTPQPAPEAPDKDTAGRGFESPAADATPPAHGEPRNGAGSPILNVLPEDVAGLVGGGTRAGDRQSVAAEIEAGLAEIRAGTASAARLGEYGDEALGTTLLGEFARRNGDFDTARVHLDRARAIAEPRASRPDVGGVAVRILTKLGCLAEQRGDLAAAAILHGQALDIASARPILLGAHALADVLAGIACLSNARGDHERAAELLGTAHTLQGAVDAASLEIPRARAAALTALGPAAYEAAYTRGRQTPRAKAALFRP